MKRRGFLGSIAAALVAHKAGVFKTVKNDTPPMMYSGVMPGTSFADTKLPPHGMSITVPDDNEPLGWHTQHLGPYGRLVARSYPDGRIEIV